MRKKLKVLQLKNQTKALVKDCFNLFKPTYYVYVDYKLYPIHGPNDNYAEYLTIIEEALRMVKADRKPISNGFLEVDNLFISVILSDSNQIEGIGITKYRRHVSEKFKMLIRYEKLIYESKLLEEENNRGLLDRYLDNVIESNPNKHKYVLYVFSLDTGLKKSKEVVLSLIKEQCFCKRIFSITKYDDKVVYICIIDEYSCKALDLYMEINKLILSNEIKLVIHSTMTKVLFQNRKGTLTNLAKCEQEVHEQIRRQDNENCFKEI